MEQKITDDDFRRLLIEIENGVEGITNGNQYLTYEEEKDELNLTFIVLKLKFPTDTLSDKQRSDLAEALIKDVMRRPANSVLMRADLPEGYGFDTGLLKQMLKGEIAIVGAKEVQRNQVEVQTDLARSYANLEASDKKGFFVSSIASLVSFVAAGGIAGIAGALILAGTIAAFPPILIAPIAVCLVVGVIAGAVAVFTKFHERDTRNAFDNTQLNISVLEGFLGEKPESDENLAQMSAYHVQERLQRNYDNQRGGPGGSTKGKGPPADPTIPTTVHGPVLPSTLPKENLSGGGGGDLHVENPDKDNPFKPTGKDDNNPFGLSK